jgi:hypothetical protein
VIRRDFDFRRLALARLARAKRRVPGFLIVGVHRVSAPPGEICESIFAPFVSGRV